MIGKYTDISPNAKIGNNVKIANFTTIHDNVTIGDNTVIHPNVVIYPGTKIGENCEVYPGAVLGAAPQDLKYHGEETTVEIGNGTVIREGVTIHKGTEDKWKTTIGDNCLLMTYVHIAHDCQIGNNVILAGYAGLSGHCVVEDYAILEGKVATQQFIRIGAHSFIAGATLVRKAVPPFVKAAREPIGFAGVNSIGLRRRGFDPDVIKEIEDIYRLLFVQNVNMSKGIEAIESTMPDSDVRKQILDFIAAADKGIIKGLI